MHYIPWTQGISIKTVQLRSVELVVPLPDGGDSPNLDCKISGASEHEESYRYVTYSRTLGYDIRCQTGSRNVDRSVNHHNNASNINLRIAPCFRTSLVSTLLTLTACDTQHAILAVPIGHPRTTPT